MTISKNKIKFIQSLQRKKNRDELGLFLAEGDKLVQQLLSAGIVIQTIAHCHELKTEFRPLNCELIDCTPAEIKKISNLKTPPQVIAVCEMPAKAQLPFNNNLIIVLDSVQDPGNLGTIIRLASWFGIKHIVCSEDTADCYNPKVVQASMGAVAHVTMHYTNLYSYLITAKSKQLTIYGTFLEGNNIYKEQLKSSGIIVMGNEGKGISEEVASLVDKKLLIPNFSQNGEYVESLNVSMATAIICSEFMRDQA